jgi:putative copper resistance protein D
MNDGPMGALERLNYAFRPARASHLAWRIRPWFCRRLAKGRWQNAAIFTMTIAQMGHYAVAGVLLSVV